MKKILVITPSFSGGSWIASEKILDKLAINAEIFAVGLGNVKHDNKKILYFRIPYPKYESWGALHSKAPLLAILWNIPLMLCFIVFLFTKRPNLVISNGFSSSLILSPLIKFSGAKFIVLYHGNILGFMSDIVKRFVRQFSRFVDLVIVNSRGGFEDIRIIIPPDKILINEHFAVELFFKNFKLSGKRKRNLSVLYVGSLNKEKIFFPLVEVSKRLRNNSNFNFIFVGSGRDQSEVEKLSKENSNISFLGYIGDRRELKKLYDKSDVVWSFADETYLGIPAAEALATGTPLIVPKYPALSQKQGMNKTIKKYIVPDKIGWLVDTKDDEASFKLITSIQKTGISNKMKKDCYEYALKNYSPDNLNKTIKKINYYLK